MKKYDNSMMKTAFIWSEESSCNRMKVGAVLAKDGRILCIGYNGTIKGQDNSCEDEYFQCEHCFSREENIEDIIEYKHQKLPLSENPFSENKFKTIGYCKYCSEKIYEKIGNEETIPLLKFKVTNDLTLHAEQNVITFAAKNGIKTDGTTIYVTAAPCKQCSKLIAQSGIERVVYATPYRDTTGINFLEKIGIKVEKGEYNGQST
jgi:dCMP deaminase